MACYLQGGFCTLREGYSCSLEVVVEQVVLPAVEVEVGEVAQEAEVSGQHI